VTRQLLSRIYGSLSGEIKGQPNGRYFHSHKAPIRPAFLERLEFSITSICFTEGANTDSNAWPDSTCVQTIHMFQFKHLPPPKNQISGCEAIPLRRFKVEFFCSEMESNFKNSKIVHSCISKGESGVCSF